MHDKGRLKIFHPNLTHFESRRVITLNTDLGNDDLNEGVKENKLLSFEALGDIDRASKTEMTFCQGFLEV